MTGASRLGYHINNPGNLRVGSANWRGMDGELEGFIKFQSPVWGLRAMAITLISYRTRRECVQSVEGIIGRWAPSGENDTTAYVKAVADELGVGWSQLIDVTNPDVCGKLLKAITRHENGVQPYGDATIHEALVAAGLSPAESALEPPAA